MLKLVEQPTETPAAEQPSSDAYDLLQQWLNLSADERAHFARLVAELNTAATAAEEKNLALANRFGAMANASRLEAKKAASVIEQLESVTVQGEKFDMQAITQMADSLVNDVIGAVMGLARNAMRMVYSLEDVSKSLVATETSIEGIERINRQTIMLALNARIEAERAGAAGATFKVVADEVKALSNNTDSMAIQLREQIDSISANAQNNDSILRALAEIDISRFVTTRNKIRDLNERMHLQSKQNGKLLGELGNTMQAMSTTLDALVEDMQKNAEWKPLLRQALGIIAELSDNFETLQQQTAAALQTAELKSFNQHQTTDDRISEA